MTEANFINIYKQLLPKNQNVIRGKLCKALSYEKDLSKMLMKLTPVAEKTQD